MMKVGYIRHNHPKWQLTVMKVLFWEWASSEVSNLEHPKRQLNPVYAEKKTRTWIAGSQRFDKQLQKEN